MILITLQVTITCSNHQVFLYILVENCNISESSIIYHNVAATVMILAFFTSGLFVDFEDCRKGGSDALLVRACQTGQVSNTLCEIRFPI